MRILAIETSCDETGVAILECVGDEQSANFTVLSHALNSQIQNHIEFGGVYPMVAKREHARILVPLLENALEGAEMLRESTQTLDQDVQTRLGTLLEREADMAEAFITFITETERPQIDAIAVTHGPGLEPALWVGVNFAQALALAWNIPLVPVDHMEGHLLVALCKRKSEDSSDTKEVLAIENVAFPILGLLISGAHTEINLMEEWLLYRRLGETRDDAVGEAFDKVGRMLNFPYPGGPVVASYAQKSRQGMPDASANPFKLPRPMIDSPNFDFSFSGLKTAVLYTIKDLLLQKPELPEEDKELLSRAFEDAAADVLVSKISRALEETQAQTLAIGGGVSANQYFHTRFEEMLAAKFPYVELHVPPTGLTGDNGIMIGIAGFYRFLRKEYAEVGSVVANGKLRLAST